MGARYISREPHPPTRCARFVSSTRPDFSPMTPVPSMGNASAVWMSTAKHRHLVTLLLSTLFIAVANVAFVPTLSPMVYAVMLGWMAVHLGLSVGVEKATEVSARRGRYAIGLVVDTLFLSVVYLIADGAQWVGPLFYVYTAMVVSATLSKRGVAAMMTLLFVSYTLVVASTVFGWVHPTNLIGRVSMEGNTAWGVATTLSAVILFLFAWLVQRGVTATIRSSEARYALLVQSAPDLIVTFDIAGQVVEANPAAIRGSGFTLDEMRSRKNQSFFLPEEWDAVHARFLSAMRGEATASFQFRFPRKDGEVRWLDATVAPLVADGELAKVLVVARDITEVRAQTEQLRVSAARLRLMLTSLNLGFFTVDAQRRFNAAEGAWARAREREGLEFIGKRSGDFIAPRLAELLERGLDEVFAGSDAQFEFTGRTDPDRAKRTYRTFLAPIRNEALEVVGAVGLWTDITEAKAQEEATAELQRRLSEVERAESLGRLVSGVAHELNNPLTAILNFTEELTATAEDERQRLALSVIRAQAHRSRTIVRDLLTYVKAETPRPLSVHLAGTILTPPLLTARTEMAGHQVTLTEALEDLQVSLRLDVAGFEQIVSNLLGNAADASSAGGTVVVRSRSEGGRFLLEVEDDGRGIPAEHLSRIWEPFFTTKEPGRGMGLGLSVSRGLAQSFGGDLSVTNLEAPAHGARFTLSLPIVAEASGEVVSIDGTSGAVPSTTVPGRALTVMVIDDEPAVRLSLEFPLKRRGWAVELVADGLQGWEILRDPAAVDRYDAIICDLRMPKLSGQVLYERLAEAAPALASRMILCTGDATAADFVEFLRRSPVVVLEKPYQVTDLLAAVERVRPQPGA